MVHPQDVSYFMSDESCQVGFPVSQPRNSHRGYAFDFVAHAVSVGAAYHVGVIYWPSQELITSEKGIR